MDLNDLDNRHASIREKLYTFGFEQPLPINAMGLVSALLDDLIKTTENLKAAKAQINCLKEVRNEKKVTVAHSMVISFPILAHVGLKFSQNQNSYILVCVGTVCAQIIMQYWHHVRSIVDVTYIQETTKHFQEKIAWNLGVEPYKCDNARLLAECNQLHQQQLKQRDHDSLRFAALSQQIRRLEIDKRHLNDHAATLEYKLRECDELHIGSNDARGSMRPKKDGENVNRKPFVSTVRSGYAFARNTIKPTAIAQQSDKCSRCSATAAKGGEHIDKLQMEIKNQTDMIAAYKKQVCACAAVYHHRFYSSKINFKFVFSKCSALHLSTIGCSKSRASGDTSSR